MSPTDEETAAAVAAIHHNPAHHAAVTSDPVPLSPAAAVAPWAAAGCAALLAACGGGDATPAPDEAPSGPPPSARDAARFLSQASFGPRSTEEVQSLQAQGLGRWIDLQFAAAGASHVAYLEAQRRRERDNRVLEEMSYEAIWQQWLFGDDPLRARVSWAWLQIFVISNIAPDIRPHAMSSYMDMLNRNAFGNYRQLLEEVTLHPAMGYYLNMLESEKEDPQAGTHPNENYAREVLQLFSIGLVRLNLDGTPQLDANGRTTPTYDEAVVKGFAKAFSGWAYGGLDNRNPDTFHDHDENVEALWTQPMQAWTMHHDAGAKTLLDGRVLPPGQTPQQDMRDALDNIFQHPNVGPFIAVRLIQRLVTSNPGAAYVTRVARVFNDNGAGVRGDLRAVLRAILLDTDARGDDAATRERQGKLREPALRFAQYLRALGARSANGRNAIHYLDSADDALGQSPLLAPSVFNFYSPFYRPAGALAQAGLVAPEFQITGETSLVGALNFFAWVFQSEGYGWDESRLRLDLAPLVALAGGDGASLLDRLDLLFFDLQMSARTRARLLQLLAAMPATNVEQRTQRVKATLTLSAMSPDHVVQK
ncbi:MAG: DUF1800 family protein [Aquabacterium sp.]